MADNRREEPTETSDESTHERRMCCWSTPTGLQEHGLLRASGETRPLCSWEGRNCCIPMPPGFRNRIVPISVEYLNDLCIPSYRRDSCESQHRGSMSGPAGSKGEPNTAAGSWQQHAKEPMDKPHLNGHSKSSQPLSDEKADGEAQAGGDSYWHKLRSSVTDCGSARRKSGGAPPLNRYMSEVM